METFNYSNGDQVTIICSGETGNVLGRADYLHDENQYYVEYLAADGRGVKQWWPESSLRAA